MRAGPFGGTIEGIAGSRGIVEALGPQFASEHLDGLSLGYQMDLSSLPVSLQLGYAVAFHPPTITESRHALLTADRTP